MNGGQSIAQQFEGFSGSLTTPPYSQNVTWITLDVYTQAVNSNKRAAKSKAVKMTLPSECVSHSELV